MTQATSDPEKLYRQAPILIETLADHTESQPEEVAVLLCDQAQALGGDENALHYVINEFITI